MSNERAADMRQNDAALAVTQAAKLFGGLASFVVGLGLLVVVILIPAIRGAPI